ncbi:DUF952 domain-containing protein [Bauldia sp.]|uniref:DUF952 domain-containing protein n=1 Tax=Bauldia sp. TaxID=2575872 RepID=UPI003BA9AABD
MAVVYKICPNKEWRTAEATGVFKGSDIDLKDGFIHLSNADQVAGTLEHYFAGQAGLVLVAIDSGRLGDALRHEPSRDGVLYPHLHGALPMDAVLWVRTIDIADGRHMLPDLNP